MKRIIFLIGGLVLILSALYILGAKSMTGSTIHNEESFKQFKSIETDDKCATPPYTTEEEWKRHMSHHPEMYKECL